jgi:hypothetical protein
MARTAASAQGKGEIQDGKAAAGMVVWVRRGDFV